MSSFFNKTVLIKLFGVTQGLILAIILLFLYLRWKTDRSAKYTAKFDELNSVLDQLRTKPTAKSDDNKTGDGGIKTATISSTFPSWDDSTSAHEILGVNTTATADEIETAYKTLLKKYHPDRFSSWGEGYQRRAHYIILRLQKARDEMVERGKS